LKKFFTFSLIYVILIIIDSNVQSKYEVKSLMLEILTPASPHGFAANTYVIHSDGESAVIDPTVPYDASLYGEKIKYIILTHAHFDHILEIDSWKESGAEVIVSANEKEALGDSYRNCYRLFYGSDNGYFGESTAVYDGDILKIGSTSLTVMDCPGHTLGSMTLVGDNIAFVGDTVFEGGGFGRCDLPTGNYVTLLKSIEKICTLADDTLLYSGHGNPFTVGEYKKYRR